MSRSPRTDPRYSQARLAALTRLRELYPGAYARLLAEEEASRGLILRQPDRRRRPQCGTVEAYRWHLRHGEPTDDACRKANAADRRRAHRRAYARARQELRRLHPEEYWRLVDKELGKEPAATSAWTRIRQRERARALALSQLHRLHLEEYRRLLDKERGRS